jgi:plasmid maintenance system antidote protein VapI
MTESEEQLGLNVQVAAQLGVPHVALSRVANGRAAVSPELLRE